MALLLIELVESFAIAICYPRHAHRLLVSVDSLLSTLHPWHLHLTLSNLRICHFIADREAPRKPVYIQLPMTSYLYRRGQPSTLAIGALRYVAHVIYPLSACA